SLASFEVDYWTWIPPIPFEGTAATMILGRVGSGKGGVNSSEPATAGLAIAASSASAGTDGGLGRPFEVAFGFRLDPISSIMILVVTGVGFLIHVYSTGYMAGDPGYARYFSYLNLFTAMMLTLVLASNFLVMFV